ncbi:S46 family peptidase [Pyxidicoccus parkwayensis]|uniref:Dipeptidyl-peptidase n=1 Tax=Pyxidicoccus parkwayensis TaxID=2813578 RepID=A0ABX7NNQ9_9BACT|nr:S46 family peptidase [Pyxidicoccus parkwaysis]QSQ20405.1 S46 family peptidase [Pyxidicoccus parkwaysis]
MDRRLLALGLLLSLPASADEGMWTYDAFPSEAVKKAYGFAPTQQWLDKVRLGSVRLAGGCSASFVSPDGLVMTNHHCVRECVEDLSSPKEDLLAKGFLAKTPAEERRCPKIEANQLVKMTDVTERMNTATKGLTGAAFNTALKKEMSAAESECATSADVRCDVVTLFNGGKYQLYQYRRFQDVRLVFAPEFSMAAFGGDPDNFNFPRFGFDAAFLRVWQGDAPAKSPDYLPWAKEGAKEGDLVFVSGHPGGTERKATVAELEFQRDVNLPYTLLQLAELRGMLREFASTSAERYRTTRSKLRAVENGLKALRGRHQALADPALLARKRQEEAELRKRVDANAQVKAATAGAWEETAQALDTYRRMLPEYKMKEGGDAYPSELFTMARHLVRAAEEQPKPNAERLREYTEAQLPSLRQQLLRAAPIPLELEEATLGFGLNRVRETLGADDSFVQLVLGREAPADLARALVRGTKLGDVKVRQALLEGGKAAVDASKDPMILLARKVDADARAVRKRYEDTVEAVLKRNGERIAKAHLAVYGTSGYPDATFTLRLNYGQVKGWDENGRAVAPLTTFGGAYARNTGKDPFKLPDSWMKAQAKVPASTPLDMATTNDIIGGNSGSPVVNRDGRVVGLIFDGNLHSLGGRYAYVPETNRAVAVHGDGILTALEHVYGATRVVKELRAASEDSASPAR